MKKRVYRSEIELAKETTKAIVLLSIIVLIIAVFMLIFSGAMSGIIPFFKNSSSKHIDADVILDIDNVNIERFFNSVKITSKNVFDDKDYSNKKELNTMDLDITSKFRLASNIYLKDLKIKNGLYYVEEKSVKEAYELLFGDGSYLRKETIPYYGGNDLEFDGEYFSSKLKVEDDSKKNISL